MGLMKRWRRLTEQARDEETDEEIEIRRKRLIKYRDDLEPGVLPKLEDLTVEDLKPRLTDVFETEHGRRRMFVFENVSSSTRDAKGAPYPSEGVALIGETEVTDKDTGEVQESIFADPLTRTYTPSDKKKASAPSGAVDAEI